MGLDVAVAVVLGRPYICCMHLGVIISAHVAFTGSDDSYEASPKVSTIWSPLFAVEGNLRECQFSDMEKVKVLTML